MFVSEVLAVSSATCIALSAMFVSELKGRVGLFRLTRWQMISAFLMTAAVATLLGGWRSVGQWQLLLLGASSVFGIMIASTTYYAAIYTAGPRITALLFSLTSPFALGLGYVWLGETITARQGAGVALVLAGVALAISPPLSVLRRMTWSLKAGALHSWKGLAFGTITALGQAFGNIFARPAMASGVEPFTAMAIRSGFAVIFFVALAAFPFARTDRSPATARNVSIAVMASFFGTGLGMSQLMAALTNGNVGVVSTLSSVAPVAILPMIWVRSGTLPPPTAWVGALLAIGGTALISIA